MPEENELQEPVMAVATTRLRCSIRALRAFPNRWNIALALLGMVFFFIYSALIFFLWLPKEREVKHLIYNWPDATANQVIADQFIDSSRLSIFEPLNTQLENIVHPRSMKGLNGAIVSAGFLGMPFLFGAIGKIIGHVGILFLSPLFAIFGVWGFYWLLLAIFDRTAAFWSAVLAFILPAYLYYSTLIMLPNVVFISILIAGFALILHSHKEKQFDAWRYALGMYCVALAATVRTVELPWIMLALIMLWIAHGRRHWFAHFAIGLVAFALAFVPILFINKQIYGEYFSIGYLTLGQTGNYLARLPRAFAISGDASIMALIKTAILPFGWDNHVLLFNVKRYIFSANGPLIILACAGGLVWIFKRGKTRRQWWWLAISTTIALWLAIYYGNWRFDDPLVLRYNLIGSSYTRYFIPVFLLLIPWVGVLIGALLKAKMPKIISRALLAVFIIAAGFYAYKQAYAARYDGLLTVSRDTRSYYELYDNGARVFEKDAILIVDRTDKIFFPKYDVVIFLADYTIFPRLKKVVGARPIYYVTMFSDSEMSSLNKEIRPLGLRFSHSKTLSSEYRAFTLEKK